MKNAAKFSLITLLVLILILSQGSILVFAKEGSSGKSLGSLRSQNENSARIKIRSDSENEIIEGPRIRIQGNRFEARGEVSAVSPTSITVNGLEIKIDPALSGNINLTAILTTGEFVRAEGRVENGELFAQQIRAGQDSKIRLSQNSSQKNGKARGLENKGKGRAVALQNLTRIFENILARLRSPLGK